MPEIIDGLRDPYGLHGGAVLSGSITLKCDAFWYLPITNTFASIKFNNSISGSISSISFTAGNGVYGPITEVTQSSGLAMVYSGSYMYPQNLY